VTNSRHSRPGSSSRPASAFRDQSRFFRFPFRLPQAREASALADKLYARAKDLFAHGAIAEADLEQAP